MEGESSKKVTTEKAFLNVHKLPVGDTPYVRAKHLQLVEKDQEAAIVWFWKAINAGDRVESALKDMAVVMKQQNRTEEAIEAIKSFRHLCSKHAQGSLDNILIDLYKKCGRYEEQIHLLKQKLHAIYCGKAFNGKTTRIARTHGKKFQISIKQETARVLSNLGWVYMQQEKYGAAEAVYLKAQLVEPDANIACNLGLCLIKMGRFDHARYVLNNVLNRRFESSSSPQCDDKMVSRAKELMREMEKVGRDNADTLPLDTNGVESIEQEIIERLELLMNEWAPLWSRRLPIFEEISPFRNQIAC